MSDAKSPDLPILLVDDEEPILTGYTLALRRAGLGNLISCRDGSEAIMTAKKQDLELVLLDLNMPGTSGEEALAELRRLQPALPIIIVTGKTDVESAVDCMRGGAHDYLVKPVSRERILTAVRNAVRVRDLERENTRLRDRFISVGLEHPESFDEIVTANARMKSIFLYIEAVAETGNPVLLTGETGVGKELVARAIHKASGRSGPFMAVNVAGLDDTLFSDTLFGHRKGAFTGAERDRRGLIEQAEQGSLFLDEIGDLTAASQIKLLRLLQEKEYLPLGQDTSVQSSARVIVATNADLATRQREGSFRADLFFRLQTHRIHIPPLRDRLDDLPLLVGHFLQKAAAELGRKKPTAPGRLAAILAGYSFPGNVRELEGMITDAVSQHRTGQLPMHAFLDHIGRADDSTTAPSGPSTVNDLGISFGPRMPPLRSAKRVFVEEALRRTGGRKADAARLLGITRQALNWHVRSLKRTRTTKEEE